MFVCASVHMPQGGFMDQRTTLGVGPCSLSLRDKSLFYSLLLLYIRVAGSQIPGKSPVSTSRDAGITETHVMWIVRI